MKCEVKHNGNIEMGPLWLNGWGLWLNTWGIYGLMMYICLALHDLYMGYKILVFVHTFFTFAMMMI